MKRVLMYLSCFTTILAICAGSAEAMQYVMHDIGTGFACDINNNRQVLVVDYSSGTQQSFLCNPDMGNYTRQNLNTIAGCSTGRVYSINNHGQIVGNFIPNSTSGALLLNCDSTGYSVKDIGTLGKPGAISEGINDNGQVVGVSNTNSPYYPYSQPQHAFLWDPITNQMQNLCTIEGCPVSCARSINNIGQVVGFFATTSVYGSSIDWQHAFLWDAKSTDGKMLDLGTLGGRGSDAHAINDSGQIVGAAQTSSGYTHAFLWDPISNKMQDICTAIPSNDESFATDINNKGQIIGYDNRCYDTSSSTGDSDLHAFIWQNGELTILGEKGLTSYAYGINDDGWIAGAMECPDGTYRAVIWEPVPEPSSILALLSGIAGFGGIVLQRKK